MCGPLVWAGVLTPDLPTSLAHGLAHTPGKAFICSVCGSFPLSARAFLNRVRWFDSGREH